MLDRFELKQLIPDEYDMEKGEVENWQYYPLHQSPRISTKTRVVDLDMEGDGADEHSQYCCTERIALQYILRIMSSLFV